MSSVYLSVDDTDLDDAELWAVIDSAAAAHSASNSHARRPSSLKHNHASMPSVSPISPTTRICKNPRPAYTVEEDGGSPSADGEVLEEPWASRPRKMMRMAGGGDRFDCGKQIVAIHRNPGRSQGYSSSSVVPERYGVQEMYPVMRNLDMEANRRLPNENFEHSLSLKMPSVSLFKQYQNAAMAILEKGDYTMIAGHPFIKKTGWRKISFFFNLSFEIKDKKIDIDQNRNVQRAEFIVRAFMQGGRFSDGWGSCERGEKKFTKPNHDIPSTAETRAKNKACQDLLGIGEYRPGAATSER
ncbi:uncharacterized protein LOC116256416 isoform X1 [Nymphaea colorata]|nr:uncharacterized protein LOC116256416 isoform X1 [Nymphaea colorata]